MSYRIDTGESPGPAARRIAGEQAEKALGEIRATDEPVDWRVHQLRKRCKKIRAVARLIRPGFDRYKDTNGCFRDIARHVSDHRDARVMAELVEELAGSNNGDPHPAERWYGTRCRLAEEHAVTVLGEIEEPLADAAFDIERWDVSDITMEDATGGLQKTLARAEERFRDVGIGAASSAFHEWRKRCKYHRLHIDLLEDVLPETDGDRYALFKKADSLIGDEHDCTVLVESITSQPTYLRERVEVRELLVAAMRRRRELRRKVLRYADGLFSESAGDFAGRIGEYWRNLDDGAASQSQSRFEKRSYGTE